MGQRFMSARLCGVCGSMFASPIFDINSKNNLGGGFRNPGTETTRSYILQNARVLTRRPYLFVVRVCYQSIVGKLVRNRRPVDEV